jgi:hypothetical protein
LAFGLAVAVLAALIVYVSYHPFDSVAVERGDALWACLFALLIVALVLGSRLTRGAVEPGKWPGRVVDWTAWSLAGWMMLAAFGASPPGNQRLAINEAWVWVCGAAVLTSVRRLSVPSRVSASILLLLLACSAALATHALHQSFVSLPQTRLRYEREPDTVLRDAGVIAPEGSAERMVFENRLYDGGPTATFALANSLAGVLVVGLLIALGALGFRWPNLDVPTRAVLIGLTAVCLAGILVSGSRSAVGATALSVMVLAAASARKGAAVALTIAAVASLAVIVGVGSFGKAEWWQRAPASLATRFQYWRSTVQLVADRPLFGAGPGNFQSIYERYREDLAGEQIADPHNFLMETIASGGLVAGAFLLALGLASASIAWNRLAAGSSPRRARSGKDEPRNLMDDAEGRRDNVAGVIARVDPVRWLWIGAGIALVAVWALGIRWGLIPDVEANLLALPIALVTIGWISRRGASISAGWIDRTAAIALAGLLIHLLVSGGWTVPGVAIHAWVLGGVITRVKGEGPSPRRGTPDRSAPTWPPGACLLAVLILIAWLCFGSIRPVRTTREALTAAGVARQGGSVAQIERALDRAVEADPWDAEATIQKADLLHWKLIARPSEPTRQSWSRAVAEAKRRGGDDPAVYRSLGQQQLHLYQRYGDPRDLDAAAETIAQAAGWSRANEWFSAQLALIRRAQGDADAAGNLARRAKALSIAAGDAQRDLAKQMLVEVAPIGPDAADSIHFGPASDLLTGLLSDEFPR